MFYTMFIVHLPLTMRDSNGLYQREARIDWNRLNRLPQLFSDIFFNRVQGNSMAKLHLNNKKRGVKMTFEEF